MQGRHWSVHVGQAYGACLHMHLWPPHLNLLPCRPAATALAHSLTLTLTPRPPPPLLHATCLRTFTRMDYDNLPDRLILIRYDSLAGWRGSYQNGLLCPGWLYQGPWGGVWSGKPVILGMNSYYAPG